MNIFDTLKYKKFYKNRFFGFDFSTESKIALINFINITSKKDGAIDDHVTDFVNTYGINYMVIGGGDNIAADLPIEQFNTFNANGIKGLDDWSDFNVPRTYLNEMRNKYDIRYMIFRGNCGSSWTALKVAQAVKVESMLLTTPAFTLDDLSELGFDPVEVHGVEYKQFFKSKINSVEELDTFPILLELKDQGVKIDLHWAGRLDLPELPRGEKLSDHYELKRAQNINPKRNLKVHLHDLPMEWHTHNLHRHLIACGKLHRMIREEVYLANIYLNSQANSSL
jgi:hypothetical protein